MRAVKLVAPHTLALRETPVPELGPQGTIHVETVRYSLADFQRPFDTLCCLRQPDLRSKTLTPDAFPGGADPGLDAEPMLLVPALVTRDLVAERLAAIPGTATM